VLLMQNNNDHMGGYVKWFTDMPATNGYPKYVVFPADDDMTVVMQGPFGGDRKPEPDMWRGVKRHPHHAELRVGALHPELRSGACRQGAKALRPRHHRFVGIYQMSFAMGDFIMKKFSSARYVDSSEMVDRIKVIKAPRSLSWSAVPRSCRTAP